MGHISAWGRSKASQATAAAKPAPGTVQCCPYSETQPPPVLAHKADHGWPQQQHPSAARLLAPDVPAPPRGTSEGTQWWAPEIFTSHGFIWYCCVSVKVDLEEPQCPASLQHHTDTAGLQAVFGRPLLLRGHRVMVWCSRALLRGEG